MKKFYKYISILICFILLTACGNDGLKGNHSTSQSGKTINVNGLELKVKSKDIKKEVKPRNPQGYYAHYKEHDGYYYHVLQGTLKNTSSKKINVTKIKVESISKDDHNQGKLLLINPIHSYFWDEIEPNVELNFYLFSLVKEGSVPSEYRFYYDKDGEIEKEQTTFDEVINYKISKDLKIDSEV